MSALQEIQDDVQKTAEAIADVLKIEVEIADADLIRVAGTGKYRDECGHTMLEGFVYRHVLESGNTVVIENPGCHELCQPCPRQGGCTEDAEIAAPIMVGGTPVGVIGLVSFDAEQTNRLLENRDWMLKFIGKMAELIAGMLPQTNQSNDQALPSLNLNTLEKETIIKALAEVAGDNRSKEKAAELLGISRATLYRKLKEYDIG